MLRLNNKDHLPYLLSANIGLFSNYSFKLITLNSLTNKHTQSIIISYILSI